MHDSDGSWETEVHTHISMSSYESSLRQRLNREAIPILLDQDRSALITDARSEQLENNISQLKITN